MREAAPRARRARRDVLGARRGRCREPLTLTVKCARACMHGCTRTWWGVPPCAPCACPSCSPCMSLPGLRGSWWPLPPTLSEAGGRPAGFVHYGVQGCRRAGARRKAALWTHGVLPRPDSGMGTGCSLGTNRQNPGAPHNDLCLWSGQRVIVPSRHCRRGPELSLQCPPPLVFWGLQVAWAGQGRCREAPGGAATR